MGNVGDQVGGAERHEGGGLPDPTAVAETPSADSHSRSRRSSHTYVATVVVAVVVVVAALYLARAFFIPLIIGILGSYALSPLVSWVEKLKFPRPLAAAVVVIGVVTLSGYGVWLLSGEVAALIEKLPETARDLRRELHTSAGGPPSALQNIQEVAKELQGAATDAGAQASLEKPSQHAAISPKRVLAGAASIPEPTWLRDYTLAQSALVATVLAQTPIVLLLTYFLLASGSHFRRKMVGLAGSTLSGKKEVVRLLEEIHVQVQRYMLATLLSNLLLALTTWAAFASLGVEEPAAWGAAAGVLHFIPYLGPAVIAVGSGVAGFLQFGSLTQGILIASVSLLASGVVGFAFMTWLQGRMSSVNASALFIALLFFGWLWGFWGLLLGAPLVSIAKAVFDRVESLKPIGEFIGH